MPRRPKHGDVDSLVEHIDGLLSALRLERKGSDLRDNVRRVAKVYEGVRDLGISVVREGGIDAATARERMRVYLIAYVGLTIPGVELEVVSGISEYARRLRELRVELGYQVATGKSPDPESGIDLKQDEYLLVDIKPDADAARRWHVANRIRRLSVGSKERVLQYFQENVGIVVTTEELAYVAREAKAFARRARELRTEDGYAVATKFTGRPDLRPGQYVLETLERRALPHDRRIPDGVQREVYERDASTCQLCAWSRDRFVPGDPRILELHHVQHHVDRGPNTAENLIVICSRCHDQIHAGRLTVPPGVGGGA